MFKLKVKPKINNKKLLFDKELEIISLDTELKYETELSEDVTMLTQLKVDLNPQTNLGLNDIKSAELKFTKKF